MSQESKPKDQLEREFYTRCGGTYSYASGVSGSRTVTGKVQSILAHATSAGSIVINGGDTIPIPAGVGFSFAPEGNLDSPTIVFTGTDMYLVELLT